MSAESFTDVPSCSSTFSASHLHVNVSFSLVDNVGGCPRTQQDHSSLSQRGALKGSWLLRSQDKVMMPLHQGRAVVPSRSCAVKSCCNCNIHGAMWKCYHAVSMCRRIPGLTVMTLRLQRRHPPNGQGTPAMQCQTPDHTHRLMQGALHLLCRSLIGAKARHDKRYKEQGMTCNCRPSDAHRSLI